MTGLERRLLALDVANHGDSKEAYEKAKYELAWWVFRLWKSGRLDANITLHDRKEARP